MTKKISPSTVNSSTANSHPFKVGKHYQNRDGDYVVVSIAEPNIVIRYANGYTVESLIALHARIWENMQEDNDTGHGLQAI